MEKVKERKEWYPDAEKIQELKADWSCLLHAYRRVIKCYNSWDRSTTRISRYDYDD